VPGEPTIPIAQAFIRSLKVLIKFSRVYGLDDSRCGTQLDITWKELRLAIHAAGSSGLLLCTAGPQMLLNEAPPGSTQAERSFADLLNSAGVASICFLPSVERDEFANLVKAFAERGPKAGSLSHRLERYSGKEKSSGILVNENLLIVEDTSLSEAHKEAAVRFGQLADVYSNAANQKLLDALSQIGQQLCAEKNSELPTILSAAFVRLSQEAAQHRYYRAVQQVLDCLADIEEIRPSWVQSLRTRVGLENLLPAFIEETLTAETTPDGLIGVLMRVPESASDYLAMRLSRAERRTERERVVSLAKAVGNACVRHLAEVLEAEQSAKAATATGLLSRLDPLAVANLLPQRLRNTGRNFHDSVVRHLSIAGAEERGRLLADSIELLDPRVLPLALDEIGMCGDSQTEPKLLRLAQGELLPDGDAFLRVKAIEALGRMRARAAAGHLRQFIEARKNLGWAYPEEIRTAAAQALAKLDPNWVQDNAPRLGLNEKVLELAPLDPAPEHDMVRHRRHRRIRFPRHVPAVITSRLGKYSSNISVLSLDGGLLSGDMQLAVGTEAMLKIPSGLRSINMRTVVRFVRPREAGFEMVGMGLEDRAKLRRLLVSLGGDVAPVSTPQESI
jgi:hypothetical protein